MKKYLELFKNGFDGSQVEKSKPENWPYVGYSTTTDEVVYTVVPVAANYLCLEPLEENNQLAVLKLGSGNTQYSFDKETWTEFPIDESNPLNPAFITVDRPVYLKGNNPNGYVNFEVGGCKIVGSGKYNVSGDATTLLNEKGNVKDLTPYGERCLASLFGYLDVSDIFGPDTILPCLNVVDVSELILPSTILTPYCYARMFAGIEESSSYQGHIINAPKLPATTLAAHCYEHMFSYCMDLEVAPELPATKLAPYCYSSMFSDYCGIKKAPELPATTLADRCYAYMFAAAHSMTTAPKLPATKLAPYCYASMFDSCTSLTTAPELPATELAESCYERMFSNCIPLVTAPELPAALLAERCYSMMFEGCHNLNYIKCLATDISAEDCTNYWVNSVASTGTFVKHPNTTWEYSTTGNDDWEKNHSGVPVGWDIVDAEL